MATACVFLATKIDSAYHRLDSVAHACFRALRAHQQREPEPEYYDADGVSAAAASTTVLRLWVSAASHIIAHARHMMHSEFQIGNRLAAL
jgi:hypothetical protein